jgi:hypothetical protein
MAQTTWRTLITEEMESNGSSWDDVVAHTFQEGELDGLFNAGATGPEEGCPFTLWTSRHVYFPLTYDGSESVGSAPRDPCSEPMRHIGVS